MRGLSSYHVLFGVLIFGAMFSAPIGLTAAGEGAIQPAYIPLEEGEYHGDPNIIPGVSGFGVHLNADTHDYVASPANHPNRSLYDEGHYTVSGWIKLDDLSSRQYLLGDHRYKYSSPAIYVTTSGKPVFRIHWNRDSLDYSIASSGDEGDIQPNVWYHFAAVLVTKDQHIIITLYVNSNSYESATMNRDMVYSGDLDIGRGKWNHNEEYTNGSVSAMKIYDQALPPRRIQAQYTSGQADSLWQYIYMNDTILPLILLGLAIMLAYFELTLRS